MKRQRCEAGSRWVLGSCALAFALSLTVPAGALQNGLARTPPMGWNSYNKFAGNVTEAQVKAVVDAFATDGLQAAGYEYIVVDYCWMQGRDSAGQMVPVSNKFPSGMKSLSDYVHSKGLKFGMYQSPTKVTCCGEPGSYQHEASDAKQFAGWGVDYVKYDWCGSQSKENGTVSKDEVISRYKAMSDAILASGRPMVYAMCEKGQGAKVQPATWSEPVGNMWRTGNDIAATWARVLTAFDVVQSLSSYAKPGGWNDPDMLEVGNGSLTDAENRAHFSLWAIVAAPLMMGNDPSKMSASVKAILTNAEVIAVDQDPLGRAGERVAGSGQTEVWAKPLQDGSVAVVLFNRGSGSAMISASFSDLKVSGTAKVRDLWLGTDKGSFTSSYSATVGSHDVNMVRIYPPGVTPAAPGAADAGTSGHDASPAASAESDSSLGASGAGGAATNDASGSGGSAVSGGGAGNALGGSGGASGSAPESGGAGANGSGPGGAGAGGTPDRSPNAGSAGRAEPDGGSPGAAPFGDEGGGGCACSSARSPSTSKARAQWLLLGLGSVVLFTRRGRRSRDGTSRISPAGELRFAKNAATSLSQSRKSSPKRSSQ